MQEKLKKMERLTHEELNKINDFWDCRFGLAKKLAYQSKEANALHSTILEVQRKLRELGPHLTGPIHITKREIGDCVFSCLGDIAEVLEAEF